LALYLSKIVLNYFFYCFKILVLKIKFKNIILNRRFAISSSNNKKFRFSIVTGR
jgi:hypothetical protein